MSKYISVCCILFLFGCADSKLHNAKGEQACLEYGGLYEYSFLQSGAAYIRYICKDGSTLFVSWGDFKEITGSIVLENLK